MGMLVRDELERAYPASVIAPRAWSLHERDFNYTHNTWPGVAEKDWNSEILWCIFQNGNNLKTLQFPQLKSTRNHWFINWILDTNPRSCLSRSGLDLRTPEVTKTFRAPPAPSLRWDWFWLCSAVCDLERIKQLDETTTSTHNTHIITTL